jgi:hypothetical protein
MYYIGCSFKFILKVGVAESIVNTPRISCLNLTSLFALFMFLPCRLMSCAFTIAAKIHWSSVFDTSNVNQVLMSVYMTILNYSCQKYGTFTRDICKANLKELLVFYQNSILNIRMYVQLRPRNFVSRCHSTDISCKPGFIYF